jgi:cytochrome c peroxidase
VVPKVLLRFAEIVMGRSEVFHFGEFTLEVAERRLTRAGAVVRLAPKAHDVHNGSAATLEDVIDAYQAAGFQFNFTPRERAHIVAFLKSL